MKQIIAMILILLLFSGYTAKEYKMKDSTVTKITSAFATIYNYLDKSNLPHQDVKQLQEIIINADSSLRADITDSTMNKK